MKIKVKIMTAYTNLTSTTARVKDLQGRTHTVNTGDTVTATGFTRIMYVGITGWRNF